MMRPGMKNGRDPARALVVQGHGGVVDAADAADAGADHHAGGALVLVGLRVPAGVVQGLAGGRHRVDDERVDLALLLRLHPGVGIEGAVAAVAERARNRRCGRRGRRRRSAVTTLARRLSPAINRLQVASTPLPAASPSPGPSPLPAASRYPEPVPSSQRIGARGRFRPRSARRPASALKRSSSRGTSPRRRPSGWSRRRRRGSRR